MKRIEVVLNAAPRPRAKWPNMPAEFRNVSIKCRSYDPIIRGNSVESFEAAVASGVRFAEADFRLSADGILVSAHDDEMPGSCGSVARSTVSELKRCELSDDRHVGTLDELLRQDLQEYYLELKDTDGGDPQRALFAVATAVEAVRARGLLDRVLFLIFDYTPEIEALLTRHGARVGLKGYPRSSAEVMEMVHAAAAHRVEMVCANIAEVTPEVIEASAALGVWHMAWYTGPPAEELWLDRIQAGVGGLMTGYCPRVADAVASAGSRPSVSD